LMKIRSSWVYRSTRNPLSTDCTLWN